MFTLLHRMIHERGWLFFWGGIALMAGIVCGSFVGDAGFSLNPLWLYGVACSFILVLFLIPRPLLRFVVLVTLFFVLGIWRFLVNIPGTPAPNELRFWNGTNAMLAGIVSEEVDVRERGQRVTMRIDSSEFDGETKPINGTLLLSLGRYPELSYGDRVRFSCQLETPEPFNGFAYDQYLARFNIFSTCSWPQHMRIIEHRQGSSLFAFLFSLKSHLTRSLGNALPEPHAALVSGIALGTKRALPEDALLAFNRTGLTHVIVISGAHMVLFAQILSFILTSLGLWPRQRFWAIALFLFLFTAMIGFPPSAMRGMLLALLLLLGEIVGRVRAMANALVATAVLMLLWNPMLLRWDAGFQLSFLASIGLVYVAPILESWFGEIHLRIRIQRLRTWFVTTRQILTATFGAIIMTTPLITASFGQLSLVAPLANLLVVPIVPWVMIGGFVAAIVGTVSSLLGTIIGVGLQALSSIILMIVETLASFSFASIEISYVPLWIVIVLYAIIIVWVVRWQLRSFFSSYVSDTQR